MASFDALTRKFPKNLSSEIRDKSAFIYGANLDKPSYQSNNAGCYAYLFSEPLVVSGKAYVKLLPAIGSKEELNTWDGFSKGYGLSPQLFRNIFSVFYDHGFFPKEAALEFDKPKAQWAVVLPPGSYDILTLKLASFTYRYLDCVPWFMLAAYRQYLALRAKGVSFYQCFHWACLKGGLSSGHGIYYFTTGGFPAAYSPFVTKALSLLTMYTPEELKENTVVSYDRPSLSDTITYLASKAFGSPIACSPIARPLGTFQDRMRWETHPLSEDSLLDPRFGRYIQDVSSLFTEEIKEIQKTLPTRTLSAKEQRHASYY